MQLGIVGLPKVGKTTLFNALTAGDQETGKFGASTDLHLGVAQIHDPRLARLRDLYEPRRYTPATVTYVDVPGVERGDGHKQLDLARLREVDALVHVVRAFDDPEILHTAGGIDPVRDIRDFDLELILADLDLVERRLGRLAEAQKRGLKDDEKAEAKLLEETVQVALENETPLRDIELAAADEKRLRGFQLLSEKPLLVVYNVAEADLDTPLPPELDDLPEERMVVVSAPIEAEISRLEASDQADFLADLALSEPSSVRLVRSSLKLLDMISFFTVGEDEVRAWTIPNGTTARRAAGKIHTDLERGFIRAEVVGSEDLLRLGSLASCRDEGLLRLEGKEYPVRDGEVMHIRFNV